MAIDSITFEVEDSLIQICCGDIEVFPDGNTRKQGVSIGTIEDMEAMIAAFRYTEA